jgi:integrase
MVERQSLLPLCYLEGILMPRKQLTQQVIERLRPDPGKTIERPDHLYPALRLIVQPSGSRSFAVRTRIAGKTAKITLKDVGLDLKAARDSARKMLEEIAAGIDPRAERKRIKATTFKGVADLYLKDSASHVRTKTQIERKRHLNRDWAPLHNKPLAEIRKADVAARLLELKDEYGAIAANRSRTTLHNMMEWAIDQDLIEANVVASTRRPLRREPTRDRVLTPDERRAVWTATDDEGAYSRIVRLLQLTLQRKSEVSGMMRSELDLEKAIWSLPGERTKNGLPHLVPMSKQAVAIIKAQLEAQPDGEHLFGKSGAAPFSGWSRAKRRLDGRIARQRAERRLGRALAKGEKPAPADHLAAWTLHDLRRTGSTAMNDELGIAPHVVEAVINHISGEAKRGVAGTYNRAQYLAERTWALQAWADHLTSEPARKVVKFRAPAARR